MSDLTFEALTVQTALEGLRERIKELDPDATFETQYAECSPPIITRYAAFNVNGNKKTYYLLTRQSGRYVEAYLKDTNW